MSWMDRRRKVRRTSRRLELLGHEPLEQRCLLAAAPILGNAPPMLDPISDATIAVGQPLTFTATASDTDGGTPLTFQLDPNETPTGATINRTTGAFSWTPTAAQVGEFRFVVIVSDQNTRPLSDADVFRVQVSGENQSPVNTVPGNQFTPLNQPLVFSQANGNKISVADTDVGTAAMKVTLGVTSGTLSLSGITGLTFTTGDGTGDASMVFTGTLDNINTALNGMTFTPANNATDEVTLTLTSDDQGNTGTGGAKTDTDTVLIRVSSINQPPVNTVPGAQTMNEDGTLVFSAANSNAISIADPDAGSTSSVRVVLSATNGTLSLSGVGGLTFNTGDGSADASMDFTGTIAAINTALAGMSFAPTANFAGAAAITITTNDQGNTGSGGALSDTDIVNVTVNPVNDAPVNTVPAAQTMQSNSTLTFSAANGNVISAADVDAGASPVQVTLGVTNGTLTLSGTTGLTFTTGDGTGDASMVFTGTLANVNAALAGMSFTPTNSFAGDATLTLTTNDQGNTGTGGALSDTDTVTITVQAPNAPPVNQVPSATQNINEDSTLTFASTPLNNAIQVADPDAGTQDVQVTLTVLHGTLTLSGTSGLTFTAPGDGTNDATMTFTGPIAAVNAALTGMTYRPTLNFNGEDTLTILTSDLGHTGFGGAKTDSDSVSILVAAVNDGPVVTVPGPQATQLNTPLVLSSDTSSAVSIADVDAGSGLVQVTLTMPEGAGVLSLSGDTGLSFSVGDGTSDRTMTFNGTLSAINTALDGLTYTPATDFNNDTTLTVTASDLGNTGSGGALTDTKVLNIGVGTANDPPVNTVPSGTVTAASGVDRPITGISIADPDAAAGTVRVTLSVEHGTLSLSLAVAGGVSAAQVTTNGTGSVQIDAPLAAINATLGAANGLIYRSNAAYTGADTLTVLTDDQGNTGTGGAKTDSDTVAITVQAENQPPSLTPPAAQTIRLGDPFTFTFTASDPDVPAQTLAFQIDSIPTQPPGSNADEATVNPTTGAFNWTPDTPGTYVFVILVTDNGLPAKSDSEQFSITVQADNAPPVNTVPSAQSTPVNTNLVFTTANSNVISVADPDVASQPLRVTLAATNGTLTLSGISGLTFGTGDGTGDATMTFDGTLADINAALLGLSFSPTTDFTGTAEVTITTNDLGNTGFGGQKTDTDLITIAVGDTVNDPPVNTVPAAQTTNEDTALVFSAANSNLISVADPDVGTSPVRVTLGVTTGTLTLSGIADLTFTTGDGTGDATMTFTGTLAAVNAALAGMSYTPALNDTGDETLTITTNDQGATGTGGEKTDTDTVVITITPVNDPPLFDTQDPKNATTNQPFTFTVTVTDVEAGTLTWQIIEVTEQPAEVNNSDTATIDPETGVFNWTPNLDGTYRFLLSVTDNGSPPLADTIEVTIIVGTPNAPPVNTVPAAQNLLEDTQLVFSTANTNAISVADPDAGTDEVEVTLTAQHGGLTLGATGGLTFTAGDGTSDATMTFRGTMANVNTALSGLSFTPPANFFGLTGVSISTSDLGHNGSGGPKTDLDAVTISVTPVNDVPSFTVGPNVDAVVGQGARTIEGWATNISPGPGETTQALSFQVGTDHPEFFAVPPSVAPDGTLTFTPATSGAGGVANVSVILSDDGGTADGGDDTSNAQDFTITIAQAINAPPVNTVPGQQGVTEDIVSPLVFSVAGGNAISVADADAGTGALEVTLAATGGTLSLSGVTGLNFTAGDGTGDATMTFTGTLSAINAALEGMTYSPGLNVVGAQTLTITTNDQGNTGSGGAQSDTDNVPITILPVNDSPVNSVPAAQTTPKNAARTFSEANANLLSISDVDDGGLDFEITLSVTNGTLTLGSTTGLSFSNGDGAGDATMTFTGTEAEVNTALDGLVFTPTTDFVGTATLSLQTSDQGNSGSGGAKTDNDTVDISVIDDSNLPPVNSLPAGPVSAETAVDQPIGPISVSDADAGTANIQMTLAVEHGTLRVRTDVAGGVTAPQVTGNNSASVVLAGPIAAINATLASFNGLVYRSTAAYTGADTLTVISNDQGNTGSGGAKTDTDTLDINVVTGTGTLTGKVFNATGMSGFPGTGQPTLDGWTVFVDSDGDGTLDAGELSTVTTGGGVYTFSNLVAGDYLLRAVPATGWEISAPAYYFLMDGSQETQNPETRATGFGALVLTSDQSGMAVRVAFEGITGTTTGLHIHRGAAGTDGPPIYDLMSGLGLSPGFTSEVTGTMAFTASDLTDLNAGNLYVNLHTTGFGSGEIRGQILPGTVNAVSLVRGGTVATRDFFALDPESPFFSLGTGLTNDTGASSSDEITQDPTVSGRVTDNALVASLKAGFDATLPESFFDVTSDVQPNGDFTLSLARLNQVNGGPLADGSHTLHLLATDAAGRTTTRDISFRLDTTASVTVDLAAGYASTTPPNPIETFFPTVSLVGTAEPGSVVTLQGTSLAALSNGGGVYQIDGVPLALAGNNLTVTYTDVAGNVATESLSVTRTPAIVDLLLSAALQADTGASGTDAWTSNPAVTASITDLTGITAVEAQLRRGTQAGSLIVSVGTGSYSFSATDLAMAFGAALTDGPLQFTLRATKTGEPLPLEFSLFYTLDTTAPAAPSFGLAVADRTNPADPLETNHEVVSLVGTTEPGVTLSLLNTALSVVAGPDGSFVFPNITLALGLNQPQITATDLAGNASAPTTVDITRVAPPGGFAAAEQQLAATDSVFEDLDELIDLG